MRHLASQGCTWQRSDEDFRLFPTENTAPKNSRWTQNMNPIPKHSMYGILTYIYYHKQLAIRWASGIYSLKKTCAFPNHYGCLVNFQGVLFSIYVIKIKSQTRYVMAWNSKTKIRTGICFPIVSLKIGKTCQKPKRTSAFCENFSVTGRHDEISRSLSVYFWRECPHKCLTSS